MTALQRHLLLGILALVFTRNALPQSIQVSLPDTARANSGASAVIPISAGDVTGRSVLSYNAIVLFDQNVLRAVNASSQGTLSEPFGQPTVNILDSLVIVSGSGNTPLSGSGTLVNLEFDVVGSPGETSTLEFRGFTFNTGLPPAETSDGKFTVNSSEIVVSSASVDFGHVFLDSTGSQDLVVINEGTAALTVSTTNLAGVDADQFAIRSGGAPFTLAPADSQTVSIDFTPTEDSVRSAVLQIISNDPSDDTLNVALAGVGVPPLNLRTSFNRPAAGALICADSVVVEVRVSASGGIPPLRIMCEVNGQMAGSTGDIFLKTLPLNFGDNLLESVCTLVDSLGNTIVSRDSIFVTRPRPPECVVSISAPLDSSVVRTESVTVVGTFSVRNGQPPVAISCEVNGAPASLADSLFTAVVPLSLGENLIAATCTVVDSCGNQTVCADTIRVFRQPDSLVCEVEIILPADGTFICGTSVQVTAMPNFSSPITGARITCDVNGVIAPFSDSMFVVTVPLKNGENSLIATCTVVDSSGGQTVCRDTVVVFTDNVAPTCTFSAAGASLIGTLTDAESGISSIVPLEIENGNLTVDPFSPGDRNVSFRIDIVDPNKSMIFNIEVTDVCGNPFVCDPVLLSLSTDRQDRRFEFSFPRRDRYLRLSNRGLSEIRIVLNDHRFSFTSDASREPNSFLMPKQGRVTVDLDKYLDDGANRMSLVYAGPRGAGADLLLIDIVDQVDFVLDLEVVPLEFGLSQNYPNPFNPTTRIQFDVPISMAEGERVQLTIYNIVGESTRVLVDEQLPSGQHFAEWDGRDSQGKLVSSGLYFYELVAGDFKQTRRMLLLK